jgi:hypothetical protein
LFFILSTWSKSLIMGSHIAPDVDAILGRLTLEEKISLLAGKNFWETVDIPDKGVPSVKVQDSTALQAVWTLTFISRSLTDPMALEGQLSKMAQPPLVSQRLACWHLPGTWKRQRKLEMH